MGKGLSKTLKYIIDCFMDVIFPRAKNCSSCGRVLRGEDRFYLCSSCIPEIRLIEYEKEREKYSLQMKNTNPDISQPAFDEWVSACLYEGLARSMVHKLKYRDKRELASSMAALIDSALKQRGMSYDLIVPVPLSKKRFKKRGYNQAELIASEISNISNIPLKLALNKIRDTTSQVLCNADERWYNVKGAFECTMPLSGRIVILVDDIITTGATVHYCAEELKSKGASRVYAVSFAKAAL